MFVELEELIKVLAISKKNFNRMWVDSYCFTVRELRDEVFKQWSDFAKRVFFHLSPNLTDAQIHKLLDALYSTKDLIGDLYDTSRD